MLYLTRFNLYQGAFKATKWMRKMSKAKAISSELGCKMDACTQTARRVSIDEKMRVHGMKEGKVGMITFCSFVHLCAAALLCAMLTLLNRSFSHQGAQ
jgi:hypothetical protein